MGLKLISDVEIKLSPAELAKLFWYMDSVEQAQFFVELGKLTETRCEAIPTLIQVNHDAELQWLYMRDSMRDLPNGDLGVACIRDIAAWHYLYLLGMGDIA